MQCELIPDLSPSFARRCPASMPIRRAGGAQVQAFLDSVLADTPPWWSSVQVVDRAIAGAEGDPDVRIRVFTPREISGPLPGMVWFHGGGYITGDLETDSKIGGRYAIEVDAVVVHVDYRLAPENPYPAALNDGWAALAWAANNAAELGIDLHRLAVAGTSAGGGLAAAIALRARDEAGPSLAFQLLLYPALDDRMQTWSARNREDVPMFTSEMERDMWHHYLGDAAGCDGVPVYAAAGRAVDLSGLPAAYLLTADLDPLRDEGAEYARRLSAAGSDVEYHNFSGAFHGFVNMNAPIAHRAITEQFTALRAALHPVAGR